MEMCWPLYNIYTNDQPLDLQTKSFTYADDLCVTCQQHTFSAVEASLTNAVNGLHQYYAENSLIANPDKTQVCSFHLNRDAYHPLNIMWNGQKLKNCKHPKYHGVTLDHSLTFKKHIQNCKAKVTTRNILRKLTSLQWRANPNTLRTSALALCYSAAEYACPAWSRSSLAKYLDPALNVAALLQDAWNPPTQTVCTFSLELPTWYLKRCDKQTGKVQSNARPKPYAVRIPGSESKIKIKKKLPLQHIPTFQAIWKNSARAVERSDKSQTPQTSSQLKQLPSITCLPAHIGNATTDSAPELKTPGWITFRDTNHHHLLHK